MTEKRALGRGLGALIQQTEVQAASTSGELVINIPITNIKTNRYQPRTAFNQEKLNDLVNSIKEKGVVQPVLVRKTQAGGYELIAGERRLRAVKSLGSATIPAIVKNVSDVDMLEISLIENIQREELNAMEEAFAFQKFITDFKFTQDKIAQVLGKDKSTISNTMRLLALPKKIQDHISKGELTMGHAKAILYFSSEMDQMRLATLIIKKGLSVREAEAIASRKSLGERKRETKTDQNILDIAGRLQQKLGTRVKIYHGKKRGKIQIEYYSDDDFNRVLDILMSAKNA
jgi:ParB family chromosome partitioning protein